MLLAAGAVALGLVAPASAQSPSQFTLEALRQRARELSKEEYTARDAADLPEWLAKLDHEGYRRIVFRPRAALWSGEGLPFRLRFAHRGYLYSHRVPIHVIADDGSVKEAMFSPAQFDLAAAGQPGAPTPRVSPAARRSARLRSHPALEGLVLKCRLHGAGTLTAEEQRQILRQPRAVIELASAGRSPLQR